MAAQKRPLFSLVLSLVVPGLGQIYNSQVTKGLVIIAACLALGLGTLWLSGPVSLSVALALMVLWISALLDAYKTAQTSGRPLDWYYRVPYVVTMLLLVGPLALPLLWRSPYFSRLARWSWTVAVIGAVLLFAATPYLLNWLVQQMPDLSTLLRKSRIPSWRPYPKFRSSYHYVFITSWKKGSALSTLAFHFRNHRTDSCRLSCVGHIKLCPVPSPHS